MNIVIKITTPDDARYAEKISKMINLAAQARGTGISERPPNYIRSKIEKGEAVIALRECEVIGFCYIEIWGYGKYVANSGLIVDKRFRRQGLATRIKKAASQLSQEKYPQAKLFGITTSAAVMKINNDLGYRPVAFPELIIEDKFWKGCQSCPNYDILSRNHFNNCLCTAMLLEPDEDK